MISEQEFVRITTYLKSKYGINMTGKKVIVNGRLENYIVSEGYKDFGEFMDKLEADKSGNLEIDLVNMLTTNHTFFMRESQHFDFMKRNVIPWIKEEAKDTHDLRLWCGASSTGEEPYAIAMLLKESLGLEAAKWDTTILATDISERALSKAIEGRYDAEQIEVIPEAWRNRYFKQLPHSDVYEVTREIKDSVIFRKFNLMDDFPFRKPMHVIFLRNVMIYFDGPTKRKLIEKIYDSLVPGGYLFVGRTETIDRESTGFEVIHPSIFRRPNEKNQSIGC